MNNLKRLLDKLKAPNTNWKYILIVVVLGFVVGGGILGWQRWAGWQEIQVPEVRMPEKEEVIQPKPELPEEMIEDETSDWKTYRNEERGFEINYPVDWKIEIVDPWHSINFTKETALENIRLAIGIDLYGEFGTAFQGCTFPGKEIVVESVKVRPVIFSDLKNKHPNPTKEECEKQMLGNLHAVHLDMCFDNLGYLGHYCPTCPESPYCPEWKKEGYVGYYYQIFLLCEGKKWEGRIAMNHCNQLFNKIVSTFRFIE